ncbi:hypothetical protein D0499_03890 [Weissella soli]|nr:hypothetical protein [Weissella soli]
MTLSNLLLINGVSFLMSFLLIYVTKSNEKKLRRYTKLELRLLLTSVFDGVKWVKRHSRIKVLILAVAIFNFFQKDIR